MRAFQAAMRSPIARASALRRFGAVRLLPLIKRAGTALVLMPLPTICQHPAGAALACLMLHMCARCCCSFYA